ncbi:DNA repair protein XRCC1-like [Ostrinia furnacalis]|uniref:DNA repair protein XRCC1-like n=1 Tax=Ostrinia furnacalis TaxID=93504 RepID=UPI00103DF853|nr:DNA repair protein XRCC1-like [Ostrinia furnacalis]
MPRVKIDYIVSFSSEDPDNPASNLLAWDVSKKRWLCAKGEPSCSVVLQLPRAVKISAVHIGAHHAALVEVLVGRSEKPNEPFQVLVPSCVFLSPAESRKDAGVERVRSFSGSQLAAARAQRWDRVRLVCSQPYNKHCKYGLSFVHISEPEDSSAPAPAPAPSTVAAPSPVPGAALARLLDAGSSSDDEFKPGELFARHNSSRNSTDTGVRH